MVGVVMVGAVCTSLLKYTQRQVHTAPGVLCVLASDPIKSHGLLKRAGCPAHWALWQLSDGVRSGCKAGASRAAVPSATAGGRLQAGALGALRARLLPRGLRRRVGGACRRELLAGDDSL